MTTGHRQMPMQLADNLDSQETVSYNIFGILMCTNNTSNDFDFWIFHLDAVARTNAFYGRGTGPINIDEAACDGSEMRLIDCPFDSTHDCTHAEDAAVDCSTTREQSVDMEESFTLPCCSL